LYKNARTTLVLNVGSDRIVTSGHPILTR